MRTSPALCLLLLAGCAAGAREPLPKPGVLRAPTILHVNGTFEPVSFKLDSGFRLTRRPSAPCETNDRMPTGTFAPHQVAPMLRAATPKQPGPMPNLCPVTRQANKSRPVPIHAPRGEKRLRTPEEGESLP